MSSGMVPQRQAQLMRMLCKVCFHTGAAWSWFDAAVMHNCFAGPLLGGVAMGEIVDAMRNASTKAAAGTSYYSLLSMSAHYNTQLALLAGLKLDTFAPVSLPCLTCWGFYLPPACLRGPSSCLECYDCLASCCPCLICVPSPASGDVHT